MRFQTTLALGVFGLVGNAVMYALQGATLSLIGLGCSAVGLLILAAIEP